MKGSEKVKSITLGILAHVDAGKTTLSEALLYTSGTTARLGRVDKRDAYLDTSSLERERGITIFSKEARLSFGNTDFTLIDTPGHIDFSCETERALSVEDYAVLVISAPDGITAHTKTLWHLLSSRKIPTFLFINKTDISERTRREIMDEIKAKLSPSAVDFTVNETKFEDSASRDELLMEEYFESGSLSDSSLSNAISERKIFPCYFGSALKLVGISELLSGLDNYTLKTNYHEKFLGAKVYKIARDKNGARLSYMKITGGSLAVKDTVKIKGKDGGLYTEKVEEIRLYSGEKYKTASIVKAGGVCAVLGLTKTEAGMGIGIEKSDEMTISPVLDYKLFLPEGSNVYETYLKLLTLSEEEPALAMTYNERAKEIRVRLMGEIQLEVLTRLISERFGIAVRFGEGSVLYKETISEAVRGAGHFEPLRHYAEVHLLIEPLPEGSGVICESDCSTDLLALNWQRLILTHLEERMHRGVLTGSPLTDVKITVTAGKAHLKHTEGGDFRQATYRAVRQALMKAKSVLLEPVFDFRIELPMESLGKAMTDITNMHGKTDAPEFDGNTAILTGKCPVLTMRSYATELRAYTRGEGRISMTPAGYFPCHNQAEIIEKIGYSAELDERNTPNSVFCKGGSGYVVRWDESDSLMHVSPDGGNESTILEARAYKPQKTVYSGGADEDKELMAIFERTYGKIKERRIPEKKENAAPEEKKERPKKQPKKGGNYVIIDGYNFIFGAELFKKLADSDISLARDTLIRLMCDYSAFKKCKVIIVFDAYRRKGGEGSTERVGEVTVIYTKEAETADAYIEKTTHELAAEHTVRVVTSDFDEQLVVLGAGGLRVSSKEFYSEMEATALDIKNAIEESKKV